MTREFSDELLSAYLDDQLTAAERAEVEAQLAASPEQRQLLDELRVLSGEVRSLPRIKADEHFADRVMQAAEAAQGRSAAAAHAGGGKATRGYWSYALAGIAATAAAVALVVWLQNNPSGGSGENEIVTIPAESTDVQQALDRLRQAAPGEGEAIVLKIRVGQGLAPHQVLDAALAEVGIERRDSADVSTGGIEVGGQYRRQLADKYGGSQPGEPNEALNAATHAAEDAIYLDAPWSQLEATVAALGEFSPEKFDVRALAKVTAPKPLQGDEGGESEGPDGSNNAKSKLPPPSFAQRLPARMYKLENEPASATPAAASPPKIDGQKRVRVLILVERDAPAK